MDKRKQESINLEKELIKARQALENKSREWNNGLQEDTKKFGSHKDDSSNAQNELKMAEKEQTIKNQASAIEELQAKLLDQRTSQIQELDYLKA